MKTLHCPYCGEALIRDQNGELTCRSGGMFISRELERRLSEVFLTEEREPTPSPFDAGPSKWHCGGCGDRLVVSEDGLGRCPRCRRTMGEFSYQLTEFTPHCRS